MNSKQRVHAALKREPVDRLPVFMWFHPQTVHRLAALLEIPASRVAEAMGDDVRQTWVNNNYAMEGIVHEQEGKSHVDFWGVEWTRQQGFNQITGFPLVRASQDEALRYRFPTDRLEDLMRLMLPVAAHQKDYFIGCDVSPCGFEMYWRLRGMGRALLDIAEDPAFAGEMLRRCADFSVELSQAAVQRFALDWLWTGDDVSSQLSMLMSPGAWRKLIKPHLARVVAVGKQKGLWVAYHCCGALRPIIPDLIEIGVDVLNPVQCNCPGMEPLELKAEFGKHLAFMGGVDTQGVLPAGTVAEVRRATARLVEGMTRDGGGYILAASHTVPPETPDENIFAMYEEAGISREAIFDRAAEIRRADRREA
ncbi:MAG TPA: uroporphyrinogen decarboxylase family protein [Terriglobia bacterium]|nr:uroporphyrinogen decarboxylase family protein [Terriglobia bacterium]